MIAPLLEGPINRNASEPYGCGEGAVAAVLLAEFLVLDSHKSYYGTTGRAHALAQTRFRAGVVNVAEVPCRALEAQASKPSMRIPS